MPLYRGSARVIVTLSILTYVVVPTFYPIKDMVSLASARGREVEGCRKRGCSVDVKPWLDGGINPSVLLQCCDCIYDDVGASKTGF